MEAIAYEKIEQLVGRAYQEELAQYARERNVIIAADTGTGKTLVSAMVIRWKIAMERINSTDIRKVALFLVPKVPLVEQQRKFLEDNTALVIRGYTGAMGVDFWDRTAWQKEFKEADVLVMTPQIFLNILRHAHWSMSQVAMICFDEVHNCKGKSPEAQIMGDHYHRIDNDVPRPKILGLTASPIFNLKNPQKALTDIERLTACRVVIVKQNVAQLAAHTYQARDRIVDYAATLSVFPTYPRPSLWQDLHAKDILPNDLLFPPKRRSGELPQNEWYTSFQGRYASTLLSLGPFAADVFVFVHMTSSLDRVKDELVPLYPGHEDPHAERRAAMTAACEVMKAHQSRLVSDGGEIRHEWMTPKLIALKELLREQRDVPNFRGIIFTHERQIATTISLIFPRLGVPGINAGPLVGHGQNACSEPMKIGMKGMAFHAQEKILQDFRDGSLNLLIATSVAEEGLDFPLCSFVCRYDPPRTLPQYIQSRGRARKENSTFVIMLEKGPSLDRVRVQSLQLGEEKVKKMYGNRMDSPDDSVEDDFVEDDYFEGCFTVEKTGASITPAGCISLLENLCSLIPVDLHTQPLHPKYTISGGTPYADFEAHVLLPAALPIDRSNLLIKGGIGSQTKKAAKRSAAFNAVVMLYRLGVFDDYLLPIRREKGDVAEDIDGKPPIDVTGIEPMMEVMVHDAWGDVRGEDTQMFVHQLSISEKTGMGLVSAVRLAEFEGDMMATGQKTRVHVAEGVPVVIEKDKKASSIEQMETFTKTGIYHSITRKGLQNKQLSFFLVPLDANGLPDWGAIERSNNAPASRDWCGVDMSGKTELLVLLLNNSKVSRLIGVRSDLTIKDCAESDSYVSKLITHAKKRGESIPEDDVILECREILQTKSTEFRDPSRQKKGILSEKSVFLPLSQCQWAKFDLHQIAWFQLLPPLAHLISSVHRARAVQHMLEASLSIDRIIEAFTLPSASASFSNQRLETLGDAFLKLATSIHVYNKFPYKHEGQLTVLKENSVSNRYLLGRGHIRSLTSYMTVEPNSHTRWRLTTDNTRLVNGEWMVSRKIPRRSVQDCMEATLGAAWLSGGVKAALAVGTNLGLCFGGKQAWWERKEYEQNSMEISTGSPFPVLEATLGYTFKDKMLLLEALTHPSFAKGGPSYQRLEFLGDAVLDLVVLDHFFNNYPNAGPGKLSRARARCVCSPTLAAIATKKLGIPKQIFCDSVSLVQAMMEKSAQFDTMSFPQIIDSIWSLDAPKALSDVVEALLGAIFVDCGWRYDVVAEVIKRLLEDVLAYVHTEMPADPASEFMIWVARYGCTQVKYRKASSSPEIAPRKDQIFVMVHDTDVGGPSIIMPKTSAALARASASIRAQAILEDPASEFFFDKICSCTKKEKAENPKVYQAAIDLISDPTDLDPETAEGFAINAQSQLMRLEETPLPDKAAESEGYSDEGEDEIDL